MQRGNVFEDEFEFDDGDPEGFRVSMARVGKAAGGEAIAVKAFVIPPGQSVCPYHYEFEEEWLLVLEGAVVVRTPEGEQRLARGDLVRFAPGPAGAHRVSNRASGADEDDAHRARVLMFSSAHEPAVAVYPDSDKIGVWPGNPADRVMLRRTDGQVHYYDGER